MSTQHTPGPWFIDIESEKLWDICVDRGEDLWVVVQMTQAVGSTALTAEDIANARLIAAAPDLLEALKAVLSEVEGCCCSSERRARAAIAKATGAKI